MKPFVGKVRYAPEVASRPERLAKDLSSAKALVALMEEEATTLRQAMTIPAKQESSSDEAAANGTSTANGDAVMDEAASEQYEEDPEPRERGSEAVERRVEKVMSELRDQGLFAGCSDEEVEAKRVSMERSSGPRLADMLF